MGKSSIEKKIDRIFEQKIRGFVRPHDCQDLQQTRNYIFMLHKIIDELESKFHYVPDDARLLFNEYNEAQERMLFNKFKSEFNQ